MSTLNVNTINASTTGQAVEVDIKNPKSFRNKVKNGSMIVNQRGNQSSVTTSVYGLDRFKVQEAADVTYDINQSTESPNGFANSFHIDIQGAQASPSASHFMQLMTALEGFDVQDFAKGTSEAKQYAVSFYIKTNVTGNYALQITDDNSRSCSQIYTVSDTNWNRYTVIFPADTTGAIDNDNTEGLRLTWHLLVGTDRTSGTMNTTWAATTTANIAAGQNANVASSTSNNWYITGVQLEVGGTVSDFEHLSFGQELHRCARYYQKQLSGNLKAVATGFAYNTQYGNFTPHYPMGPMRTAPSLDQTNGDNYYEINGGLDHGDHLDGAFIIEHGTETTSNIYFDPDGALNNGYAFYIRSDNAAAYFAYSAEL